MGANMVLADIVLMAEDFRSIMDGGDPFKGIRDELDQVIRSEDDELMFKFLFNYLSENSSDETLNNLVFETVWALHNGNKSDKRELEGFYRKAREHYDSAFRKFYDTLSWRDISTFYLTDELVQCITGGQSWGDDPTESYSVWSNLFFNEDEVAPYSDWLHSKVIVNLLPIIKKGLEAMGESV